MATIGMALFALTGIAAIILSFTVQWPPGTRRYVAVTAVLSAAGFLACTAIAVFAAARDTYVVTDRPED